MKKYELTVTTIKKNNTVDIDEITFHSIKSIYNSCKPFRTLKVKEQWHKEGNLFVQVRYDETIDFMIIDTFKVVEW